jgi:hypothetical protein
MNGMKRRKRRRNESDLPEVMTGDSRVKVRR